ncbi:MAG: hypothetical protein M3436_20420 [Pseudomonadota bacterium]|nr:hypothetical protein [Pseudomonadota bacterium]
MTESLLTLAAGMARWVRKEGATPFRSGVRGFFDLNRPERVHSGNPAVLEHKERQHVARAVEWPGGDRGFGFTGAGTSIKTGQ